MELVNYLQNLQENFRIDLVIDVNKWNYLISHQSKFQKFSIVVYTEHQLISKQMNFYNTHKTPPLSLLDAWSALYRLCPAISRFLSSSAVAESRQVSNIQTTSKLYSFQKRYFKIFTVKFLQRNSENSTNK